MVDSHLVWLESMVRRLGRVISLALWNEAFRTPDDSRMAAILEAAWEADDDESGGTARLDEMVDAHFSEPVAGFAGADAHALVLMDAGIRLPSERFPLPRVKRQITTYDSLHLRLDGVVRLVTAMAGQLGKEGALVACSTDETGLRATTDALFLQRTSTIMEGGSLCDFRVYTA